MNGGQVLTGLDVLTAERPSWVKGRVGLVTNHAAVDGKLRSSVDCLKSIDAVEVAALFGPEHGVRGAAQAGEKVASGVDEKTGIPTHSLYGATRKPTAEMLQGLDLLVVDIPDVGTRYWTFLYTMAYCVQAAGEFNVPIVILDRPNPVGGTQVEGNILNPDFSSFVGLYPLPMRHGMTAGEVAVMLNAEYEFGADLTVIECRNWERSMLFWDTGLPFVAASPNTPTVETLLLYPGTCLIEGTVLSEGRGTTKPFELIGAPWINAEELSDTLNQRELPGVRFRPAYFVPTFSKHKGEVCAGVQVHLRQPQEVQSVSVGVHILEVIRRLYPEQELWIAPYSSGGNHFIDLLAGTDQLRKALDAGATALEILSAWEQERESFAPVRRKYLLYT